MLFAGAGVGARCGLPDWQQYLAYLTNVAARFELETASLMGVRVGQGLLAEAVSMFKRCPLIPEADKFLELAAPFGHERYKPKALHALTALPFYAIATTNYDRCLHDSYAAVNHRAPATAELGDATLRQALYKWNSFYIARIHGRAEVPKSIVIATEDYDRLEQDSDYTEFLFHVLTRTACLFVGYSFVDLRSIES